MASLFKKKGHWTLAEGIVFHRKRHREDEHHRSDYSKRSYDREYRRTSDHESRREKNPRFRESGDSDEEDDDRKRRT